MTRAPLTPRVPRTPEKSVVYAVGDIHGRLDLLDGVIAQLRREAPEAERRGARLVTVFLGDYIDRGPHSAGVLDRLIGLSSSGLGDFVFLRGNHEQVLLDLADGVEDTTRWLHFGGRETLESYGVRDLDAPSAEALRECVRQAVPARHLEFLHATKLSQQLGDYFFVHAGLRPDRLVEEQSDSDLLWFRYYEDEAPVWDHMVVHGHSPNARPVSGRWRIGIDTEAYNSGALTTLRLDGESQDLLRVSISGAGAALVEPWNDVDRSYRAASRPRSEPDPAARRQARQSVEAPRERRKPQPAPRPSQDKLRLRGRRLMWGSVGAMAVVSCTGLVLSAQNLIPSTDPVSQTRPAPIEGAGLTLRETTPAARNVEVAMLDTPGAPAAPILSIAPPAEPSEPQAQAAPAPAPGPRVQIAAVDSEAAARTLWSKLEGRLPPGSADRTMRVEPVEKDGRAFHRLLVEGFATNEDAVGFCDALKQIGQGCLVRAR